MAKASLKALTKKNAERGLCMVVHSEPGVGKSTLAADICREYNGLFILGEDGLSTLGYTDILRTPVVESWNEFLDYLEEIAMTDHPHKCVVIDTIDAMGPMLTQFVVDKYYGGDNGKANAFRAYYQEQYSEFDKVLRAFQIIQSKGIHVVILCHSVIETHKSPDGEPYQRFGLNLGGGAKTDLATALVSYSDMVLFARRDVIVSENRGRGGNRVIMSQWSPAWEAKTRKGIPDKLPLMWEALKKELYGKSN